MHLRLGGRDLEVALREFQASSEERAAENQEDVRENGAEHLRKLSACCLQVEEVNARKSARCEFRLVTPSTISGPSGLEQK
jgi:hypothetical protein